MANAVTISNLSFAYDGVPVLEGIDLAVPKGDFLGIIGPNGGGKTTLLRMILGFLKPQEGEILVFDHAPHLGCGFIGYVPQHAQLDRDFPVNVLDVVLMGRLAKAPSFGGYSRDDRDAAEEILRDVGQADLRNRRINTLSGGQLQRVLIARALVSDPDILLLDEPTASIDTRAEGGIYDLLRRINEERATIILVTHDLSFVSTHVKRVACLNRRLVCHPTRELTGEMLRELYQEPVKLVRHDHITPGEDFNG